MNWTFTLETLACPLGIPSSLASESICKMNTQLSIVVLLFGPKGRAVRLLTLDCDSTTYVLMAAVPLNRPYRSTLSEAGKGKSAMRKGC